MKEYIVLHHSFTEDGQTVSWGAIQKYHIETMGWRDIGYHYGVEFIQDQFFALLGRGEDTQAAACKEANLNVLGIHICCVGNYDVIPPSKSMLDVLVNRLILPVMNRHQITPDRIIGHRDGGLMAGFDWQKGQYKSCPGKLFDIEVVRKMVT